MKLRSTSRPASAEERRSAADAPTAAQLRKEAAAGMPDARASSQAQLQRQQMVSNSSKAAQLRERADMMAGHGGDAAVQRVEDEELLQGKFAAAQRVEDEELLQGKFEPPLQRVEEEELLQGKFAAQRAERPNNTGMPNQLKSGIESLSGMSMDHVKVHYDSAKPAQLNAHAYAQGSEIHMGPGQEQHLPHEAWHVVQQMQGRVQPTTAVGGMQVNDNSALENEATSMGNQALQRRVDHAANLSLAAASSSTAPIQRQRIGTVDVYVDRAGYPVWTQDGVDWHMTMKDAERWHITKSDRSMSYWFTVDAGTVTSTKPTKEEFGSHKKKHGPLDEAPAAVKNFVKANISAIIKVTDPEQ